MKFPAPVYDTETVRRMVETATGTPTSQQDLWNLCRPGKAMAFAALHRGAFDVRKTRRVIEQLTRRRLAAQLGRTSPRLPANELNAVCPHPDCDGIAVKWEGITLCEHGHQSPDRVKSS